MRKSVFVVFVAVLLTFPAVTALWGQTPKTAQDFYDRGIMFFNRGDFTTAIADFSEAIRFNSNYADAYMIRGFLYCAFRDYDRAIADHTQWIRLDPNNTGAYKSRGGTYNLKGDYTRAILDFETALRINPNDADAKEGIRLARLARGW